MSIKFKDQYGVNLLSYETLLKVAQKAVEALEELDYDLCEGCQDWFDYDHMHWSYTLDGRICQGCKDDGDNP